MVRREQAAAARGPKAPRAAPQGPRGDGQVVTENQQPAVGLKVAPEPWEYNPSNWNQRVHVALLAAVGFLIAVYMGCYQWRLIDNVWDPVFGDQSKAVLDSDLSHTMSRWFRVPDAILGALAYLGDIVFAMAGSTRRWQFRPWLVIVFGIDVIPLGIVSAILVIMQGTVVGAWCFLCLVTAAISLGLVVLAYDEVLSCLIFLHRVWRRTKNFGVFWRIFWGQPSPVAVEVGRTVAEES